MNIVNGLKHHAVIGTAWLISVIVPVVIGEAFSIDSLKEARSISCQNLLNFILLYITYWAGFFMYKKLDEKREIKSSFDRKKY